MNSCQPSASAVFIVTSVYIALNIMSVVSFYGWRRLGAPWRTVSFAVFAVCALLILDGIILAVVPEPASTACH